MARALNGMIRSWWMGAVVALLAVGCGGGSRDGVPGTGKDDQGGPDAGGGFDASTDFTESCNGSDEDGDRRVDEGCGCEIGTTQSCFPGPTTDNALVRCALGVQQCIQLDEFGSWDACTDYKECEVVEQEFTYGEETNTRAVDIIMVVDQSGSMSDEIEQVRMNINGLTTALFDSGIDYRLVMVARRASGPADTNKYNICVPEPLAGPNCANSDRFLHIDQQIESFDCLTWLEAKYPDYAGFLRPNSLRVVIAVSDDTPSEGYGDDDVDGMEFHAFASALPGFSDYVFHGVIGLPTSTGCSIYNVGTDFEYLANQTGGIIEDICKPNWASTFQNFATNIISKTLLYELEVKPFDVVGLEFEDPNTGMRVAQARGTVWDYNPTNNSVTLFEGFTPAPGTKIIVKYRVVINE